MTQIDERCNEVKIHAVLLRVLALDMSVCMQMIIMHLYHRYLIYTRWRIPRCGQAKIEATSQALVIPAEFTRSMIICVFFIAEVDKVDNKSSFMQLKSISYTNAEKYSVFCSIF